MCHSDAVKRISVVILSVPPTCETKRDKQNWHGLNEVLSDKSPFPSSLSQIIMSLIRGAPLKADVLCCVLWCVGGKEAKNTYVGMVWLMASFMKRWMYCEGNQRTSVGVTPFHGDSMPSFFSSWLAFPSDDSDVPLYAWFRCCVCMSRRTRSIGYSASLIPTGIAWIVEKCFTFCAMSLMFCCVALNAMFGSCCLF